MPKFYYKARSKTGEAIAGSLELESENTVASHLDKLGYSVLEIKPSTALSVRISDFVESFQKLDKQEVILFSRQLATLTRSGMPLLPSLTAISDQTTNKKFKIILDNIRNAVQSGSSLSDAMRQYPQIFSELFVSMIRVGETGGVLDKVLDRLAQLSTQEMEIQSRIRAALTYPVVLMIVAVLMVNFIMVGVIPKFAMVFKAQNAQLPIPTQIVLSLSWFFQKFGWAVFFASIGFFIAFRRYIATYEGRYQCHLFMMKVPIFGELYTKVQVSRFAKSLSTLISVGVPILQGLVVVGNVVSNEVIRKAIVDIRGALTAGSSLVEPFRRSRVFSPMVVQLVSIGEATGKIDHMLDEISNFYDPEVDYTVKNLTSLLEPLMLLGMGLMVAFIALSVLLPIFNLIKAFKG